jgi:hypothetical protein
MKKTFDLLGTTICVGHLLVLSKLLTNEKCNTQLKKANEAK